MPLHALRDDVYYGRYRADLGGQRYIRFVRPGGSDTNDGLTEETAFATLQKAINEIPAAFTNGSVIIDITGCALDLSGTSMPMIVSDVLTRRGIPLAERYIPSMATEAAINIVASPTYLTEAISGGIPQSRPCGLAALEVAGAGWTPDQWKAKFLTTTADPGIAVPIWTNTATLLDLAGGVGAEDVRIADVGARIYQSVPSIWLPGLVLNGTQASIAFHGVDLGGLVTRHLNELSFTYVRFGDAVRLTQCTTFIDGVVFDTNILLFSGLARVRNGFGVEELIEMRKDDGTGYSLLMPGYFESEGCVAFTLPILDYTATGTVSRHRLVGGEYYSFHEYNGDRLRFDTVDTMGNALIFDGCRFVELSEVSTSTPITGPFIQALNGTSVHVTNCNVYAGVPPFAEIQVGEQPPVMLSAIADFNTPGSYPFDEVDPVSGARIYGIITVQTAP